MIFTSPIPFTEALEFRAAKRLLPTTVGSRELSELAPEIRERALFSAKTASASYLAKMDTLLTGITSPATRAAQGLTALDPGTIRLQLRDELVREGFIPAPGTEGTLQDLSSDARINLIIETQLKMAYGYGQYEQAQDPDLLDLWPCQELYRLESRDKPRDWIARWRGAGGQLYGGGRMIARKDDPIWTSISEFGTPYPPFDYNSGMDVRDVRRDEAEALGIITRRQTVKPQPRGFNDTVEAAVPTGISKGLAQALFTAFKGIAKIENGKFILEAML